MKILVIYPDSFSIKPDSEVTVAFCNLLNTASENANPKSLLLEKGNYVFLSKYANERELYITNTIADKEYLFENLDTKTTFYGNNKLKINLSEKRSCVIFEYKIG